MAESEREKSSFGERLRQYRLVAALSQEALAERAGLSIDAVRALERGRRAAPRADTLTRLVEALDLSPGDRRSLIASATGHPDSPGPFPLPPARETAAGAARDQTLPVGGFLGSLPAGSLVARRGELAGLLDAIEAVQRREGRTVFLCGEAGVGKTRLAQEATMEVRRQGFVIAAGRCYEAEQGVPYYPFLELFREAFGSAAPEVQREAAARWPYLGTLLPNLLPLPAGVGAHDEQQRVFFAAAAFLEMLAEAGPVALLLDDLHWADTASLRLLRYVSQHARATRVLILATYRDVEIDSNHPLTDVLRELGREGLVERVTLSRLGEDDTASLLEAAVGEAVPMELTHFIHGRTEGNPFFTLQLTREMIERGDVFRADDGWTLRAEAEIDVPETVRSVIGQRVRRLSPAAQETLREASVLGETFRVNELAEMEGRGADDLEQSLDEAEEMGLIRETGANVYGFDHALMRHALYHELPARRRRRLHRAAAEAIKRLPERQAQRRASDLVWHYLESDETYRALPYAVRAGDQAEAVFAHVEAERHYRTALRLAEEQGDTGEIVQIYVKMAGPIHRSGRFDEALNALEEAAEAYERANDLANLMPVMAEIGGVHGNRGTPEEGMARLGPLLPRFEVSPPSSDLIYLYASYGSLLFVLGRALEHFEVARRSADVAANLQDTRAQAVANAQLGLALLSLRRREEGRVVLEKAMALAEQAGDLATLGHALNNAAYVAEVRGEFDRSIPFFIRGLELARRTGNRPQSAFMATALSRNHLLHGDWARSQEYAEEAVAMSRALGPSWVAPYPLLGFGRLMLAKGELLVADRYLEEGLAHAQDNSDLQALLTAQRSLAELDLLEDRAERAVERLAAVGVTEDWDPDEGRVSLAAILNLAQALVALGRQHDALRVVEEVKRHAQEAGEVLILVDALRLRGVILLHADDLPAAEQDLAAAEHRARAINYPYARALALESWAAVARRTGKVDVARARLDEALATFRRLGAARDAERVLNAVPGTGES